MVLAAEVQPGKSVFAKATYRGLAQVLFGGPQGPDHWKTHELSDRTIRLVRTGLDLMRGAIAHYFASPVVAGNETAARQGWRESRCQTSPSPPGARSKVKDIDSLLPGRNAMADVGMLALIIVAFGVRELMFACAVTSCLQQIIPTTSTHDRLSLRSSFS